MQCCFVVQHTCAALRLEVVAAGTFGRFVSATPMPSTDCASPLTSLSACHVETQDALLASAAFCQQQLTQGLVLQLGVLSLQVVSGNTWQGLDLQACSTLPSSALCRRRIML